MTRLAVTGRAVLLALVLGVATVIAYAPALQAGFVWDDDAYVTENVALRSVGGLLSVWVPGTTPQYYPVTFTTFWAEFQVWGNNPTGYHILNLALHVLNALLIWRLALVLAVPGAYAVALVFALHPIHVESVAWVTERKNVLSLAFYLLAALSYLHFDTIRVNTARGLNTGHRIYGTYLLVIVTFAAALLSKSVTASLPVALVLMMLWRRDTLSLQRLWPLLPMLVLGAAAGLHTAYWEQVRVGAVGPDFDHSITERVLIASRALLFYAGKLVVPWPLMFTYPRWDIDTRNTFDWWSVGVCFAIFVAVVMTWLRGYRGFSLGVLFFAVTLFPALGFANIYPMRFSFVADHFVYHASLGLIALAVGAVSYWSGTRPLSQVVLAVVVLSYVALTLDQSRMYKDEATLWRTTIERNRDSWVAHSNLATLALEAGDPVTAEHHAKEALKRKPEHWPVHVNLSNALRLQGRLEEALVHAERALEELDSLIAYHDRAQHHWMVDQLWSTKVAVVYMRRDLAVARDNAARDGSASVPSYRDPGVPARPR